eukprot:m.1393553 g.1393553  ORF g.1393553 m.1393553 type:complete len:258 (+) comp24992_c0_seq45:1980-2753(+)
MVPSLLALLVQPRGVLTVGGDGLTVRGMYPSQGNIRVFCRLRPKISEDGDGPQSEFAITQNRADDQIADVISKGKKSSFDMDVVFPPTSTQQQVFQAASDLIHSVIDGYNVCIFAYGQTGSGKTFTMEGSDEHPGLNRRALKSLFDLCEEKKADWSYEFEVSVMEIYNETLRDLLNTDKKAKDNKLEIKHGKSGPHVPGVIKRTVRTVEEVRVVSDRFVFTACSHFDDTLDAVGMVLEGWLFNTRMLFSRMVFLFTH